MDHVAIMQSSWRLTDEVIKHTKTIETRWYNQKRTPWDRIRKGDSIYFKDSGSLVRVKAEVSEVEQYEIQDEILREKIIEDVWLKDIVDPEKIIHLQEYSRNKRYVIIMYFGNALEIKPFQIDKRGFGMQSAWITIEDVERIKK